MKICQDFCEGLRDFVVQSGVKKQSWMEWDLMIILISHFSSCWWLFIFITIHKNTFFSLFKEQKKSLENFLLLSCFVVFTFSLFFLYSFFSSLSEFLNSCIAYQNEELESGKNIKKKLFDLFNENSFVIEKISWKNFFFLLFLLLYLRINKVFFYKSIKKKIRCFWHVRCILICTTWLPKELSWRRKKKTLFYVKYKFLSGFLFWPRLDEFQGYKQVERKFIHFDLLSIDSIQLIIPICNSQRIIFWFHLSFLLSSFHLIFYSRKIALMWL